MHAVAKMTNLAKKTLQRFGENLNAPCKVSVAKLTKLANLAKIENQAENNRAKRAPWRVAVFTKMAHLAKMANWALKFDMDLANVQISWQKGTLGNWRFWRKSESGKNSQNLPMVWRYIKISCKKDGRDETRNREWKIRVNNIRQKR